MIGLRSINRNHFDIVTKESSDIISTKGALTLPSAFSARGMRRLRWLTALAAVVAGSALPLAAPSVAAASPPTWKLTVTPDADYFLPGPSDLNATYTIEAENIGDEPTTGQITIQDTLPTGITGSAVEFHYSPLIAYDLAGLGFCPSAVECDFPGPFPFSVAKGQRLIMVVRVNVAANASGPIENKVKISGGDATEVEVTASNEVNADPPIGFHSFEAPLTNSSKTTPYTQAGGHPYQLVTELNFSTVTEKERSSASPGGAFNSPVRDPKDISTELPPGLIGNPQGVPHCSLADFFSRECPLQTAVGTVGVRYEGQTQGGLRELAPLYNLQPNGAYPGELGFEGAFPFIFTAAVRSGSDYGLSITSAGTPEAAINRVRVTTWGVPADPSHDALRGKTCLGGLNGSAAFLEQDPTEYERNCENEAGLGGEGGGPAGVEETPFLTMPTECSGDPLPLRARYNTWQVPSEYVDATDPSPAVDGCNVLSFEPTIESRPTTTLADAPSGLEFNLHVPQNEDPEGVATPELKEAVVKLPAGLSVNPASADGLGGCSEIEIGLHSEEPPTCPKASKLGGVEVNTPLLVEPLTGSLYLATPHQNPFGSLLAGYIALEGQGLKIKLPGRFETDKQTGQITAKFLQNPQLPFEDLKLDIFGGARGALRTPAVCGTYQTTSVLTPYSAPESGHLAEPSTTFPTTAAEHGGACPTSAGQEPHAPRFLAGSETPQAGIYSPFSLKLVRQDGEQEIKGLDTTLPEGLVGKLAGIPYCPDAAIAAASNKTGTEEQASPSCPASSEVGTVEVGAGAGPTPLNVPGHVYLSGPYKGAPISLTIITPAVAGPFDLGTVVVRAALYVNPETTQIHAVSDPIPTILEGIPLDVRSVTLKMARPKFTLNPTSCEESHFIGSATSILGTSSPLEQRFQLGGCSALAFKPKLALRLSGHLKRRGHPALTSVLTMPPGGANIASAVVALPPTEILDNAHIKSPCTRVEFAADACPPGSVLGSATAITPLLDKPLEGPVYLMTGFGHKLPDLLVDLGGQIQITLDGKVDTTKAGGLRTTFATVPDAPVSKFVLKLAGARKGLLQNTVPICANPQRASALFSGQNAASVGLSPKLKASCPKGKRHQRAGRRRGHP